MRRIFYYLPSIIFNAVEFLAIILIGVLLEMKLVDIICIILLFAIIRMLTKSAIHYKNWKLCLFWSTFQMFTLFLASKAGIAISVLITVFTAIVLSGKGDLTDIFMWNGEHSLNREVFDWVKYNQDNIELKKYEEKLKETDKKKYYIFKYRFREFKSYKEINELMDLGGTQRVTEELKIMSHFIEYSIRLG